MKFERHVVLLKCPVYLLHIAFQWSLYLLGFTIVTLKYWKQILRDTKLVQWIPCALLYSRCLLFSLILSVPLKVLKMYFLITKHWWKARQKKSSIIKAHILTKRKLFKCVSYIKGTVQSEKLNCDISVSQLTNRACAIIFKI